MPNNYAKVRDSLLKTERDRNKYREFRDELIEISRLIGVIDKAREKQGLTKKQLADLAGIEPANVRRLLTNPKNLSILTLLRLTRALQLDLTVK